MMGVPTLTNPPTEVAFARKICPYCSYVPKSTCLQLRHTCPASIAAALQAANDRCSTSHGPPRRASPRSVLDTSPQTTSFSFGITHLCHQLGPSLTTRSRSESTRPR